MMRDWVCHCGSPACTVYMLTDTTNWRYSSSIALSPLPRCLHQSLTQSRLAAYVHLAAVSARAAGFGETVVEPAWTSNYQFVQLGCPASCCHHDSIPNGRYSPYNTVSWLISNYQLKRDLNNSFMIPIRISICIPITISSLTIHGTSCITVAERVRFIEAVQENEFTSCRRNFRQWIFLRPVHVLNLTFGDLYPTLLIDLIGPQEDGVLSTCLWFSLVRGYFTVSRCDCAIGRWRWNI